VALLALLAASCSSSADGSPSAEFERRGRLALTDPAVDAGDSVLPTLTPRAELTPADDGEVHVTYAPEVPPPITRSDQRVFDVALEVLEGRCPLDPAGGVDTEMWGYRIAGDVDVACGSPGPVIRGRVGDLARITLTNPAENVRAHNIDFHSVTGQGGGAADLTVAPGETATIEVRLLYPGTFMYHCAFGDVPMHIAHGMYGMFIVDPEESLPEADHEWAVMQSEWYVGEAVDGLAPYDPVALLAEEPRYVTFNGRTDALTGDRALRMAVGERARIHFVNEGLNLASNWHPIGSHWDVVYPEAATHPANRVIRGSQSTLVVAGGGTVTELVGIVPSTVILVDHALVRTFAKGAIGQIVVEGPENPEVFSVGRAAPDPVTGEVEVPAGDVVAMPAGAWNPVNAATAYTPGELRVALGATVTWRNDDSVIHTVTSGASTGTVTTPDGLFDSGDLQPGESFSFTFDEPGTFDYFCTPHPWMVGRIVVEA
jgi:nitrite reductase (NO-forming)